MGHGPKLVRLAIAFPFSEISIVGARSIIIALSHFGPTDKETYSFLFFLLFVSDLFFL